MILVTSLIFTITGCLDSNEGDSVVGEVRFTDDQGWDYVLYADGTAVIVGTPDKYKSSDEGRNECKKIEDIPGMVNHGDKGYIVTELGPSLFKGEFDNKEKPVNGRGYAKKKYFTEVTIPDSIKKIGKECFAGNTGKTKDSPKEYVEFKINFGENPQLEEIGENAFQNCTRIHSVKNENTLSMTIPDSVKKIGDRAFYNCRDLSSINLGNVKIIGNEAFRSTSLATVDLGSVESIGRLAFSEIKKLSVEKINSSCDYAEDAFTKTNVSFVAGLPGTEIVSNASGSFVLQTRNGKTSILSYEPNDNSKKVIIPQKVTILLPVQSIKDCESVVFESGSEIETIGKEAFQNSTSLREFDFNSISGLKDIEENAFDKCTNLSVVDLENCTNLLRIQKYAFDGSGVSELELPSSIQFIDEFSFRNAPLKKIDFQNLGNLTSIGWSAFSSSDSTSTEKIRIDLSNSGIKEIGKEAFKGRSCTDFVDLKGCSNLTAIGASAFLGMDIDLSGCSDINIIGLDSAENVRFDQKTAHCVYSDSYHPGIARCTYEGELKITKNTFAINLKGIENLKKVVFEDGITRFMIKDDLLIDDTGSLIRVLECDRVVIDQSIKYVYSCAFSNAKVSNIDIRYDIETSWIPKDCSASITVGSTCNVAMGSLDAIGVEYGIEFLVGEHRLVVESDIGMKYARPSISYSDGLAQMSFEYTGGYSQYDIYLNDGVKNYSCDAWNIVIDGNKKLTIRAYDRSGSETVDVVFDANGGSVDGKTQRILKITKGLTLLDSEIMEPSRDQYVFKCWILDSGDAYDFDSQLVKDIVLKAEWVYVGPKLEFKSDFGVITAMADGKVIESGTSVSGVVQLTFTPYNGYLFISWIVNGDEYADEVLTLSGLNASTSVSVKVESYSSDTLKSLVLDNPSIEMSDYSLSWTFGGVVDTSMANWSGHPSNPVVVGDYAYVRVSGDIYQISMETGIVVKSVKSVNQTDFYHHIGYANGMIVDYANGIVYDENLIPQFKLTGGTISYAQYVDGLIVCMLDGSPAAFDANNQIGEVETKTVKWKSNENDWFKLYGTASTPMFDSGFMYYIAVNGKAISLKSIDLTNGSTKDSIALETLYGQYLDDGWLTLYDKKLYLTSYAYGLFGASSSAYKASLITSVNVDGGFFIDDTLTYTELSGYNSLTSQFVIFNNRGYVYTYDFVNSKSALLVIDVSTMKVIYETLTVINKVAVPSHGSIVVDASGAKAENQYAVKVYVLSYTDSKLLVMQDSADSTTAPSTLNSYFGGTYCSQAVRFGSNGEMIWYDDSGYLQCYAPSNNRYVFIQDGYDARWYETSGETASDAVSRMDSNVVTIADTTKTIASVNGKVNDDNWSLYAYVKKAGSLNSYEWKKLENLNNSEYNTYHYFVIVSGEVPVGTKYVYEDGGKYSIYEFGPDSDTCHLVGKQLVCTEDVVRITFTDSEGVMSESSYLIPKGKNVVVEYPEFSRKGYSLRWVDAVGNAAPYGIVTYNNDVEFHAKWIKLSYSIEVSKEESSGQLNCVANIIRTSGSEDLQNLMLFIIYEYEDGKFNNVYSDLSASSTTMTKSFGVSASGLKSIYLYVVEGAFSESFNNYGELIVDCSV